VSDAAGTLPPGLKLHLEAAQRRMRELGLTQEVIDAALDDMVRMANAEALLEDLLRIAILRIHRHEGWRARRRLKKALKPVQADITGHLRDCPTCGAWLDALRDAFLLSFVPDEGTAPT